MPRIGAVVRIPAIDLELRDALGAGGLRPGLALSPGVLGKVELQPSASDPPEAWRQYTRAFGSMYAMSLLIV